VLKAIYEEDFLGFSYGFRLGRGTHDALDALIVSSNTKVDWIFDRFGQLGMAGPFLGASDHGPADDPPDPEMA